MEQNIIITIGIYKTLGLIATLIAGAWYTSHRLTKVETTVDIMSTRLTNLEGRFDSAFVKKSPISLEPRGWEILEKSGLKEYVLQNKISLMSSCSSLNNPYDIQQSAFTLFDKIDLPKDVEETVKTAAFNSGSSMEVVRRIAGIYFRDMCLTEKGYKPEDLDK